MAVGINSTTSQWGALTLQERNALVWKERNALARKKRNELVRLNLGSRDIPSPAPQPSESRGQLRVGLDTSPVQTKDSVMYRNAGDGEESTIGEASRPKKRKPGLSSNLGINL